MNHYNHMIDHRLRQQEARRKMQQAQLIEIAQNGHKNNEQPPRRLLTINWSALKARFTRRTKHAQQPELILTPIDAQSC